MPSVDGEPPLKEGGAPTVSQIIASLMPEPRVNLRSREGLGELLLFLPFGKMINVASEIQKKPQLLRLTKHFKVLFIGLIV